MAERWTVGLTIKRLLDQVPLKATFLLLENVQKALDANIDIFVYYGKTRVSDYLSRAGDRRQSP